MTKVCDTGSSSGCLGGKMMWFKAPPAVYFGYGGTEEALKDLQGLHRAFIVSDRNCVSLGFTKKLTDRLEHLDITSEVFGDVVSNPTAAIVRLAVKKMESFQPDHIIAIGGGSCLDVAKIVRIIYDPNNSYVHLKDLYAFTYMQLLTDSEQQTGVSSLPPCDTWVKKLVCIPTTSGTGSEMTPIAFVTDEETHMKRPIVSWRMTPDIVINDGFYTQTLTPPAVASSGCDALCRSLESAVSCLSNDYTIALSYRCARLLNDNLVASFTVGDSTSRTNCHNAASIGGMAMANAFLGLGHAISFVLQNFLGSCGLPHSLGLTTMLVMGQVIRFNAQRCPKTAEKYAALADHLLLIKEEDVFQGAPDEIIMFKVGILIKRLEEVKTLLHLPVTIASCGVKKEDFDGVFDKMATETLKVVGCAKTNPVQATVEDIAAILKKAYVGDLN